MKANIRINTGFTVHTDRDTAYVDCELYSISQVDEVKLCEFMFRHVPIELIYERIAKDLIQEKVEEDK